jgi:hypothetical protein
VPTEVGFGGVRKQIELALTPKERLGLQNSARVLRETIDQVAARLSVSTGQPSKALSEERRANVTPMRKIPRSAWATPATNRVTG